MNQETAPQLTEVSFGACDERLRIFRAGGEVDTFMLVTRRYVVLVDTMATPELAIGIMEAVRSLLEKRQLLVINTHADYDHCWGNAAFATPGGLYPAPIIGHEKMVERMRSAEAEKYLREQQRAETRFANVYYVEPTITFTSGLRIDGGDLTLELLPTPGHTEDHVSIWVPELRLVLAGDAAEHPIPYIHDAAMLPTLCRSLEQLATLNAAMVIPCHGGTTDPALITRNIAYFATVDEKVRTAMAIDHIPEDWAEREDLPDIIGLPYEEVMQAAGSDPGEVPSFYRLCHLQAVRAMLTSLHTARAH